MKYLKLRVRCISGHKCQVGDGGTTNYVNATNTWVCATHDS